ncbi:phosphatase PAP2 family protein [Microtetraspora sp. NBRC 16547]|uniref:phosphatase PAP2 family protein n=1 Tax=Microtetraspora sp. NBRC 16547 TaxID=3030993 RepID=UPI0024A32CF0|nr:phosphatase PAP2 family protein [Microtetraspora sp. NBRC 16547]GLW95919.1 phosphatase PAP2 family protein [Microtetraspora sp. NBRC 16547]
MNNQLDDIPDISVEWYRDIVDFAGRTPHWFQQLVDVGTDAVLLVFAALFLGAWWRARRRDDRTMAFALLAPVAMVTAYLVSEVIKTFIQEDRPCRLVSGVVTIAQCPPLGDWSLPSNHSTLVAAAAAALVVAWRRTMPYVTILAVLGAFSRVFVGVHFPHDVLAGVLLGAIAAPLIMLVLAVPVTSLAGWARSTAALRVLLTDARTSRSVPAHRR